MALVLNDRVKVTTTTSGTGAFALGAAAQGLKLLQLVLEIVMKLITPLMKMLQTILKSVVEL